MSDERHDDLHRDIGAPALLNLAVPMAALPLAGDHAQHANATPDYMNPMSDPSIPAAQFLAHSMASGSAHPATALDTGLNMQALPRDASGAIPPKKRGRSAGKNDEVEGDDRSLSIQEKNRQAQARFRQRQKERMGTLESEVNEMKALNLRLMEENKALTNRKATLEKFLQLKEEQISVLQEGANIFHADKAAAKSEPEPKAMSGEELVGSWKQYVDALAGLLVSVDPGDPTSRINDQVSTLMAEAVSICRRAAMLDPMASKVLVSATFDSESSHTVTRPDHWHNVVKAVDPTPLQREQIRTLTRAFLSHMSELVKVHEGCSRELMECGPALTSSRLQSANSYKSQNALVLLQENTRNQHRLHFDYVVTILDLTLTKMQLAQAAVQSYPYFPDALLISSILEEQERAAAPGAS